jgi:hypothetical protein
MERPPLLCKMRMGPRPRGGGGDRRGAHGDGDVDMGMGVNRQWAYTLNCVGCFVPPFLVFRLLVGPLCLSI